MTSVVVMAFGTAEANPDSAERFLTEVIGRQPTADHVADLMRRLTTVGGSPLGKITVQQAAGVADELDRRHGVGQINVCTAMRHGSPTTEDALSQIGDGEQVLLLPLSPQESADRQRYRARVQAAATALGRTWSIDVVPPFGADPRFVALMASRLRSALDAAGRDAHVIFTAHSLPQALPGSYEYCTEVTATATSLAQACGLSEQRWSVAFQSVPRAARQPWLGPALDTVVADVAQDSSAIVVAPVQFLSDHLESMYDIDVTAHAVAASRGCSLTRMAAPNADPDLISLCADLVDDRLAATGAEHRPSTAAARVR